MRKTNVKRIFLNFEFFNLNVGLQEKPSVLSVRGHVRVLHTRMFTKNEPYYNVHIKHTVMVLDVLTFLCFGVFAPGFSLKG